MYQDQRIFSARPSSYYLHDSVIVDFPLHQIIVQKLIVFLLNLTNYFYYLKLNFQI